MILNQLVAVSQTPEFQLVYEEPQYGSAFDWFMFLVLVFFFLSIIIVFIKNMMTKGDKIIANPKRYNFWVSYFKTASLGSVLIALITISTSAYESLIDLAIYAEFSFDRVAGPLAESLLYLVMGFSIALTGTIFSFVSRWKKVAVLTKSTTARTASQSPKSQ